MDIHDLEIYRLAREISEESWKIYKGLDWQLKKVIGDQYISAVDSVGANIAEGFGRFHYSDKNKFNYNARGSLFEALHWLELLMERDIVSIESGDKLKDKFKKLGVKLNNYITATSRQKRLITT